jgi:hypothetical protein
MGQAPVTGTPCAFPYANTSTMPLCSQQCSQVLGSRYEVLRVTCLIVASISLLLFSSRMFYIAKKIKESSPTGARQPRLALRRSLEFWFFIGLFFLFFLLAYVGLCYETRCRSGTDIGS